MSTKYNIETIKQEFKDRGFELLTSDYVGGKQKLQYICNKHKDKGIQEIDYNHFHYRNSGCYYCGREKTEQARRNLTNINDVKLLTENKGFIFVDLIIKNKRSMIQFICPKHTKYGVQEMTVPRMRTNKIGCKYCNHRDLPPDDVIKLMNEVNPNVELLEPYVNLTTRIKCRCKIHNVISNKTPQEILKGRGCVICGKEKLSEFHFKTHEEYVNQLKIKNPHLEVISTYTGANEKIVCKCLIHNEIFERDAESLLQRKSGCQTCYSEYIKNRDAKSHDEFIKELKIKHPDIIVLDKYINNTTLMRFKCNIHNYEFISTPANILHNKNGCPKCQPHFMENKLGKILDKWGYNYIRQYKFQDCKDKRSLPFDYYLIDFNILIEYDGEDHYNIINRNGRKYKTSKNKFEYTQRHDEIKNKYCKCNNIPLIRIPYWEKDNMEYFLFNELVKINAIEEIKKVA